MQEQHIPIDAKKESIKYGVYLGVISLIIGIITLYATKGLASLVLLSTVSVLLNFVVFIAIAVVFILALRKLVGGYWSFSDALKHIFIMLALSAILSTVGMTVFNAVNPGPQEDVINNTMNLTIELMENSGVDDEQIDNAIAEIEKSKAQLGTISAGQIIKGLGVSLIVYFLLALIFAAIFKHEKPMFIKVSPEDAEHLREDNSQ